jgi:hypothetical protein
MGVVEVAVVFGRLHHPQLVDLRYSFLISCYSFCSTVGQSSSGICSLRTTSTREISCAGYKGSPLEVNTS